jgi:hypothetical protein
MISRECSLLDGGAGKAQVRNFGIVPQLAMAKFFKTVTSVLDIIVTKLL